ncbi:uncharacterized protein ColSpa_09798 [Colletotrichum spaethianum]|uniref:Uncharacterized protein n=1 Tax=Colletotrichum spaethianum TaxID=700344 RepID=A0AA37PCD2_9PEZI|nr:uncharacterized protein ColSpa_09798 [Colletotrichum spaethianum]GKT49617.1 hypothetical protein ColSpa_09798 [Colletotrichum spaethianum]
MVCSASQSAYLKQKHGAKYLQGVRGDVKATLDVLELLNAEKELRQDQVDKAAYQVALKGQNIFQLIHDLGQKSELGGGFKRFMDHLLDGPAEQARLDEMRKELNESKATLILALQMAQVGLIRSVGKGDIIVNVQIVTQIDERVQQCTGSEEGLRLAQLLQQRAWKDEDGKWHLSDQDLAELSRPPPYVYKQGPHTRAEVKDNTVISATFIGVGVGKDGGDENSVYHPDELIVTNNKVSQGALFVGGGISAKNLAYLRRNGV